VVADVVQDAAIVQSETFGPVATVQAFHLEDEAVALANGTPFGLAASVWTKDHGRAQRVTARLDVGCVWVNTHLPLMAEMPHGGVKQSGYGREGSSFALEDFTSVKHVVAAHS
jgi:betaine-aldehyde dehydrogenase